MWGEEKGETEGRRGKIRQENKKGERGGQKEKNATERK